MSTGTGGAERPRTWTFREMDEEHACPKGAAFRAFKRVLAQLHEGRDFYYYSAAVHKTEIEELRRAGRLYGSTVNAVVLAESGYRRVREVLEEKG